MGNISRQGIPGRGYDLGDYCLGGVLKREKAATR